MNQETEAKFQIYFSSYLLHRAYLRFLSYNEKICKYVASIIWSCGLSHGTSSTRNQPLPFLPPRDVKTLHPHRSHDQAHARHEVTFYNDVFIRAVICHVLLHFPSFAFSRIFSAFIKN